MRWSIYRNRKSLPPPVATAVLAARLDGASPGWNFQSQRIGLLAILSISIGARNADELNLASRHAELQQPRALQKFRAVQKPRALQKFRAVQKRSEVQ